MNIVRALLLITTTILMSCRSVPLASLDQDHNAKKFEISQNQANVYIYRNEFLGNQIKIDVSIDGKLVGRTLGDTYLLLKLPEGEHTILSEAENKSFLNLRTEKGKNYFIWQETKMGMWLARTQLNLVSEAEGQRGVRECKLIQQINE